MGIVLVSWFWLGHLYYLVKCLCDIQALCHYVILSSAHCVQIVCCYLHIVCKLCVSFLSMSVFVSVIICHVNMLYSHCMPCHYVQCHMVIVMLWSISCGLFSWESQNWSGVVVRSSSFLCNLFEVVFTFLVNVWFGLSSFFVWECQLLCVRLWKFI